MFRTPEYWILGNKLSLVGIVISRIQVGKLRNLIIDLPNELKRACHFTKTVKAKIEHIEHHLAHMASAYYVSPFDRAAVLSLDGFGDFISTKWGMGEGNTIKTIGQVEFPHSLGIFYTALTQFLGFPQYGDEYKVMALAAYGEPEYEPLFKKMIGLDSKNGFQLNLDFFTHHSNGVEMYWKDGYPSLSPCYSQKLIEQFGPSRLPEESMTQRHQNLAASCQKTFETVYFRILNELYKKTRVKNLCLAGGCAFNSVANGKIRDHTPFERIFIQPAAGDAGTAIGAASYLHHAILRKPRQSEMRHVYLGPKFDTKEIKQTLTTANLSYHELNDEETISRAAQSLAKGKIVGWFQGRMEFGPRALGHRSLLADPRRQEMKEILNERIKHRESFRPFAPSILAEEFHDYFEGTDPDLFMTRVGRFKKDKRALVPAVSHVDGTGRFQTVERDISPKFWQLINKFKELTGVPILLNTSFNDNEPIVCTPEEAIQCFNKNNLDCLAIENFWVERNQKSIAINTEVSNEVLAK